MLLTEKSQMFLTPDLWIGVKKIFQTISKRALSQSNRSEKSAENYPTVIPMSFNHNHYHQGNNNDNDNDNI